MQQDCSNQGEALNVPTAFLGLWSNIRLEKMMNFKIFEIFLSSLHTLYKVQKKIKIFLPVNSNYAKKPPSTNLDRFL